MPAWYPQRPKECVRCPGTGVMVALSHRVDDGFSGRTASALNHYAVALAREAAILISGLRNLSSPTRAISDLPAATLLKTGGK